MSNRPIAVARTPLVVITIAALTALVFCPGCDDGKGGDPSVAISPATTSGSPGDTMQFASMVYNSSSTVVWSVDEVGGGSIAPHSDTSAVYTAPATGGVYHVRVALASDPNVFATSTVTVGGSANVVVQ